MMNQEHFPSLSSKKKQKTVGMTSFNPCVITWPVIIRVYTSAQYKYILITMKSGPETFHTITSNDSQSVQMNCQGH